jgi:hypothetical protein
LTKTAQPIIKHCNTNEILKVLKNKNNQCIIELSKEKTKINSKEKIKMKELKTLMAVHTHTHTPII